MNPKPSVLFLFLLLWQGFFFNFFKKIVLVGKKPAHESNSHAPECCRAQQRKQWQQWQQRRHQPESCQRSPLSGILMEHLKSPREGLPGGGTHPPRRRAGTNLVLPWSGLGLPLQEHEEEEQRAVPAAAAATLLKTALLPQPTLRKGTGLASLKALRGGSPGGEHTPPPPRRDGRRLFLPWDGYRSLAIRVDSSAGRGGGGGGLTAAAAPGGCTGRHRIIEGRPCAGEGELVEERTPLTLPSSSIRWVMADG